jgi:hypothetical protein
MGFFYGFIRSTLLRINAGNEERTQKAHNMLRTIVGCL